MATLSIIETPILIMVADHQLPSIQRLSSSSAHYSEFPAHGAQVQTMDHNDEEGSVGL